MVIGLVSIVMAIFLYLGFNLGGTVTGREIYEDLCGYSVSGADGTCSEFKKNIEERKYGFSLVDECRKDECGN